MTEYIIDLAEGYANTVLGVKEEIVRCEDCQFHREYKEQFTCLVWADSEWGATDVTPRGYCAWGERREQ